MAYGCVRTDNMSGTTLGKDLVSLRFMNGEAEAEIENGAVVLIGDYIEGEREIKKATAVAANSPLEKVALVASEEVDKTKNYTTLAEFKNKAGADIRGYKLASAGQSFAVTKECFTAGSALAKGNVVELADGTKFHAVASATGGSTKVGKIVAIEDKWYVVEVEA